jgi:mycoredoxin
MQEPVTDPEAAVTTNKIRIYSTPWCSDCRLVRRILDEHGAEYELIDIDEDPAAAEEVLRLNNGFRSVPTLIFPDGSVLVEPSRRELLERL